MAALLNYWTILTSVTSSLLQNISSSFFNLFFLPFSLFPACFFPIFLSFLLFLHFFLSSFLTFFSFLFPLSIFPDFPGLVRALGTVFCQHLIAAFYPHRGLYLEKTQNMGSKRVALIKTSTKIRVLCGIRTRDRMNRYRKG
jgi:hypothetical protein